MSSSVSFEYLGTVLNKPAMSAQNPGGAAILLAFAGTAIPLPTNTYMRGFTQNNVNTQFTVSETDVYMIQYSIEIAGILLVNSGIFRNGIEVPNLSQISGAGTRSFACSSIMLLEADDVLQVTLFGSSGSVTLRNGVGAYLNVVGLN